MKLSFARAVLITCSFFGVAFAVGACGGSGDSLDSVEKAKQEARNELLAEQKATAERKRQTALEAKVKRLEAEQKRQQTASTASSGPSASADASCGGGISVGPNTSCEFARSVYSEWIGSGGGSGVISAWSPVTSRWYTMSCTAGGVTTCRGGNNAVVYIR